MSNTLSISPGTVPDLLEMTELFDGHIRFMCDIYQESTELLLMKLRCADGIDDIDRITLYLDSDGGDVYACLGLHDVIRTMSKPVTIIVGGIAASGASMIVLQAAEKRVAHEHTTIMLHEVSQMEFGRVTRSQIGDRKKEVDRLQEIVNTIISKRSGMTTQEVEDLFNRKDLFITAAEAKNYNLLDEVL